MGMVVLNFREGNLAIAGELPPQLGREIFGMHVERQNFGAWSNSDR